MKKKVMTGVIIAAAAIVVITVISRLLGASGEDEIMDTSAVVETEIVSVGSLSAKSSYIGTISAEGTSGVITMVSGMVKDVLVSVGDEVAEGQPLCDIYDESARLSMESAEKSYQQTLANYGGSELSLVRERLQTAQNDYNNASLLYDAGAISLAELEQAEQALHTAQANLNAAEASVAAAAVQIETARYQYSLHHITAPVGGVVEAVNVTTNNFFSSGQVAFVISNGKNKTVTFYVTEEVRGALSAGQPVTVTYQSRSYSGEISEISGVVDASAGLFQIKAIIDDARSLPDGLSVELSMTTHEVEDEIVIPCDALYFESGTAYVYVVENGCAARKEVELGLYTTEQATISSGLEAGQMAGSLSWTISLVLISSFVSAATIVPLLFSRVKPVAKTELPVNRILIKMQNFYRRVVPSLLRHPGRVVAASVGILAASLLLATQLNFVLFNSNYDGSMKMDVTFRAGTEMTVIDEKIKPLEEMLLADANFSDVIMKMSDNSVSFTAYAGDNASRSSQEAVEEYTERCRNMTGMDISVIPMGTADMGGMFSAEETVDITLAGDDLEILEQAQIW